MKKNDRLKEANEVIKKYLGAPDQEHLKDRLVNTAKWTGAFVIFDLLITGGVGTGVAVFSSVFGTLDGVSYLDKKNSLNKTVTEENTAGQEVRGRKIAQMTLKKMEQKLSAAFNAATSINADKLDRAHFYDMVDDIKTDVAKLSPVFEIVSGGKNGFGMAQYEFVVSELIPAPGQKKLLTLEQALGMINKARAPKTTPQEDEIKALKARLDALENPKTTRLDKGNSRPPSP